MTGPIKRNGPQDGGPKAQREGHDTAKYTPRRIELQRPFTVVVSCFGRTREWGRFFDEASASAAVAKLRRHGFDAHVESAKS